MSTEQAFSPRKRKRASRGQAHEHQRKRSKKVEEEGETGKQQLDIPIVNEALAPQPHSLNETHKLEKDIAVLNGTPKISKTTKRNKQREKTKRRAELATWSISEPIGGWFLPQDPVFSQDERYLILANSRAVHIYSTATSLLVRTLPIGSGTISSYALSSSEPNRVYVATSAGLIILWDWDKDKKISRWDLGSSIRGITAVAPEGSSHDVIYTHETGDRYMIMAHSLRSGAEASQTKLKLIVKSKEPIQSFQVLSNGTFVVVVLRTSIMIGKATKLLSSSFEDLNYTWREFKIHQPITCFNACIRSRAHVATAKTPKNPSQLVAESLDLVIGCVEGEIFVFEDILGRLMKAEKSQKASEQSGDLTPMRLHWHREAVGSVKWSLDGNYIISGGKETVLLMWQLGTGKHQTLPHLTSAIDSLTVSPSGASYAIRLADNSIMVLSTTELKPKTNIAGIQSRRAVSDDQPLPQIKTVTSVVEKSANPLDKFRKIPMAVNPLKPSQILLSVPSSQPRTESDKTYMPAPYLQTFDLSAAHHLSRQALTRNNATDFNKGPRGTKIREPDIRFLRLSHDGTWLATIEEWQPSKTDVDHLAENLSVAEEERSLRREIYLKFWLWDKQRELWTLETRIDAPHRHPDGTAPCRIFDMVSDPCEAGFSTIGEDGFVRVWKPKTRLRDGTVVRGSDSEGLITWSNRHSIELGSIVETLDADVDSQLLSLLSNACLAYSADGSILAAGQSWTSKADPELIHIIDTESGIVRRSMPGLYTTEIAALGFVEQYLVVISDSVTVWDLVDDELIYSLPFVLSNIKYFQKASIIHLAVNSSEGTFAVAFPFIEADGSGSEMRLKKTMSKLMVFNPAHPEPLWSATVPNVIMALLPAQNSKGYVALDAAAEVRIVSPKAGSSIPLIGPVATADQSLAIFRDEEPEDIEVDEEEEDGAEEVDAKLGQMKVMEQADEYVEDTENDKPVVRPEQLARIFDVGPSFALPPVKDLFSAVVGLYARKPRGRPVQDMVVEA
ncbi:WD40 repeat-like protein [Glonium stellatum]|uniref:WD40 repeat-like protein n=1 Tax=Glonium stellatum TaxID=574774 RepID=A0A8E2F9F9_9PEZI|nr:WD40 repeat-like protein [Glonium stellatum]